MKQGKRKKKRSRAGKEVVVAEPNQSQNDEDTILKALVEAFCLASMDEAASAYREANCDPNKAAEILGALSSSSSSSSEARIGSSSSSGPSCGSSACSTSGSSEGFVETGCVQNVVAPAAMAAKGFRGSKAKNRVVASTGTVAGMLGKEYVMWQPKMESKAKGFGGLKEEEAEQFLCGMLGDECELSLAVVRDVLCQCGYNVEKALDALLDLSAASYEQAMNHRYFTNGVDIKEHAKLHIEQSDSLTNRVSDSTSHSSENELLDSIWGDFGRNYSEVLASSETKSPTSPRYTESDLPHKVLDSLFNISKSSEHEPSTMNWRNVVKKMESLGHVYPTGATEPQQDAYAKGDEYHALRKPASQHFDSMRSYYQKAATAYTKGNREHAAYLSEQGRLQSRIAKEADEEASQNIFKARNKDIENLITIDLHGQHVKQAMRLLKLHLVFGTFVPSVQTIRVITGCGSHGIGKSKLKESVIQLLQREGIGWIEENRGTLLIRLAGQRVLSFLDCDSETETD